MTVLYLVRHGVAADPTPGVPDAERPLTAEGIEKTAMVARGLATLDAFEGVVLSSPYVRALQTAEMLADAWQEDAEVMICDALTPDGSARELIAFLDHATSAPTVLAVGHMPSLAEITSDLIGASRSARIEFKKASVAMIEFDGPIRLGRGTLVGLFPPRALRALGEPLA
ncbi:MAG: phosphohistidine phosphatase SixA [Planctomycetes bacterium]|nr:phosphohistidine phosphatase SixA [Planctomycetota bacterium]MCC7168993.1 phosphohistidine phosphatase SixA [Planctomycetota bacterium]